MFESLNRKRHVKLNISVLLLSDVCTTS